jgi:hypothetical protein
MNIHGHKVPPSFSAGLPLGLALPNFRTSWNKSEDLFGYCHQRFPLKTVLMLAGQLMRKRMIWEHLNTFSSTPFEQGNVP